MVVALFEVRLRPCPEADYIPRSPPKTNPPANPTKKSNLLNKTRTYIDAIYSNPYKMSMSAKINDLKETSALPISNINMNNFNRFFQRK